MKKPIIIIYFLLLAFVNCLYPDASLAQKNKQKNVSKGVSSSVTTGAQDREFWSATLYKIAYPVVHNLANETLRKNLPLEKGNDYFMDPSKVTYLEAVGRTFAGIAPWLALSD